MIRIKLKEMTRIISGQLTPPEAGNLHAIGISIDTRTLKPGDLFFAIEGDKFDGHNFIEEAISKHAIGACISKKITNEMNIPLIKVKDTIEALDAYAAYYRSLFKLPIIAISGAVGKTTTREMISAVLSKKYRVVESIKNFNNLIGLPLSLFQMESWHEFAVLELGINQVGEMSKLVEICKPNHGLLTNIVPVHLEGLGNFDNLKKEKFRLLEAIPGTGKIFLNANDEILANSPYKEHDNLVLYGSSPDCHFKVDKISLNGDGTPKFEINGHGIKLSILGEHNAQNAAAAFAVGRTFDVDTDNIIKALEDFREMPLRMNLISVNGLQVINDSYNANPASVRSAIHTLVNIAAQRRIVLLGDMLELGAKSADLHRTIGLVVKDSAIDYLITYGKEAAEISESALNHGMSEKNVFHSESRDEINDYLRSLLSSGDLILVKGSRGMQMEQFVDFIQEELNE
ncbi:UDP-N-acetylmuramoyl-tripeptide--D-alanyl-D-alanine ligase [bacterium]|nr:UDP-N-acetylmuramoyl-tripeptide--D-alanyl-D-alanine ligase [bacterium]